MSFTDIYELRLILWPRIDKPLLEGYFGGVFNEDHDKFYAATLVKLSDTDYRDFEYYHGLLNGYSLMFHDDEKTQKFITPNSRISKSTSELIDEKVVVYFSVSFIGVLFEDEWFILKSLAFYGDEKQENEIKSHIEKTAHPGYFQNDRLFLPKKPLKYSVQGKTITLRDVPFEEFNNAPYLVAILKQEKKEKINRAFVNYLEKEFIKPFFEKLQIASPSDYTVLCALRSNYTMIFPVHKKHIIFCAFVENVLSKWRLKYFLFNNETRQFYEWTYFTSKEYDFSFYYSNLILDDLKNISDWNDDAFLDSSCTMDDEVFWKEYVFKKEDNNFLYLKPL